ncbi:hypothetical protein D3C87_1252740 [compost metagenome]
MSPTKQLLLALAIAPLVALAAGNRGTIETASQNAGKPGNGHFDGACHAGRSARYHRP